MVINFQSWLDPFLILTALPRALAGIERDSGAEIELRSGLNGSERVIRAPAPDLVDGAVVTVAS